MSDNISPEDWAEILKVLQEDEEANANTANVPNGSGLNNAEILRLQAQMAQHLAKASSLADQLKNLQKGEKNNIGSNGNAAEMGCQSSSNSNVASSSRATISEHFGSLKRQACNANLSPEDLAAIEALLEQDKRDYNKSGNAGGENYSNIFANNRNRKLSSENCGKKSLAARLHKEKEVDEFLDEMFEGRNSAADVEHRDWLEMMLAMIDEADGEIRHWQECEISKFAKEYRQSWPGNEVEEDDNEKGNEEGENKKNTKEKKKIVYSKSSPEYRERILDPKLIAVVARANFLATGNKPRMAQLIAVVEELCCQGRGKLIQVSTGEGKTTIIAMHAGILTIVGGNKEIVDIITSNKVLAKRDAKDKKRRAFFGMLGLKVAHNILPRGQQYFNIRQKAYKADILYGDLGSFQGDMLESLHGRNIRCGRPYCNVIIDEVDSMLVDDITQSRILMLCHEIPGSEKLHGLMEIAWKFWQSLLPLKPDIVHKPEQNCYELRKTDPETGEQLVHQFKDPYMTDLVEKWMQDAIVSPDHRIRLKIPEHLREYARKQTKNWAESLVAASAMEEGKSYKITKDDDGFKCIKILDYDNTGTTMQHSRYEKGLHEFLEIKHELKIRKGSIVTLFSSNLEYIGRYKTNIYGLTGTLGSEPAQNFLKRLYPVDLAKIPTFKRKRLEQLPGLLLATRTDWIGAIINRVKQTVKQRRAILVINETLNQVEALRQELCKSLDRQEAQHIRIYVDEDSPEQQREIEKSAEPGSIILSTNLAGRGTDIITTDEVDANGGLFVLVIFLPLNMRVQMQNFGRTARQGRPGQCQMILCRRNETDEREIFSDIWTFEYVIFDRDENEKEELETFEREQLPKLKLRDLLFSKFAKVAEELVNTMEEQDVLRMQNEELWGFKLREIDEALDKLLLNE